MTDSREETGAPSPRPYVTPLGYFLVFTLLIGFGLNALLDVWHARHARPKRNFHTSRGWVEHAGGAEPRREGETLIVIIGNSQGFGDEVADAETYARRLEPMLAERLGPVRILNWCVTGGAAPDFIVLGAAAARLDPDIVILMASPRNFDVSLTDQRKGRHPFRRWASDSHWLVAFPEIRRHIPDGFVSATFDPADRLGLELGRRLPLWRARYVPAGRLMRHEAFRPFQPGGILPPVLPERPPRRVSDELFGFYAGATKTIRGRRIVARMPLVSRRRPNTEAGAQSLRELTLQSGQEFWDLSGVVPDDRFRTASHVDAEGHAIIAHELAARLAP